MTRFVLVTSLFLSVFPALQAQQLPSNPDPDKCYVRSVTADVYEAEYEDMLTYSREEATKYAHTFLQIELTPEFSQWETTTYEDCESDNPDDCQVLCYRTHPATFDTIYAPAFDTLGSPFYKEVKREVLVEKGGLSSYDEIDCELLSYNVLSIAFRDKSAEFDDAGRALQTIEDRLLDLMEDRRNIRIQINSHTDSRGAAGENQQLSEQRVKMVIDYLVDKGITRGRLVGRGYGESRLRNRCVDGVDCADWEHGANNRLEFRVLNVDY